LQQPSGPVEAWYLPAHDTTAGPAVIFAHGNAELIDDWTSLGDLRRLGLSVLLVEFPGYGLSQGKPSRRAVQGAFLAGYDWLVSQSEVDPERVVVMGRSIGGAIVTELAARRSVRGLILLSTFSSLSRLAWESFRAPGFLIGDYFDNAKVLRSFPGPVLLVHGRRDDVIPFSHARALARAHPRAELIQLECGHNDCPGDWPAFVSTVASFLTANSIIQPQGEAGAEQL